ncbi:LysR family transcriptional regulator [Brucella sp. ZJ1_1]|uniref:LysR family transcriptional regulator n=2 Tax=Brucella intermedia TaxID=94625 RepID=C4WKR5_9HYPH|nr:LysR family transcriptional regulator [Brucella intermedia]EEQ97003.1 LysR family transcriptional regulator [Brucella intermedia LMG 3301]ELT46452.1 LysR family transcriptional regulator [Brucella intermedia M86]OOC52071.1 transcriptional regulator [Brucella intermedia M86]SUB13996.1 D-malate degradation protein R [Brucella intermedia]
MNRSQLSQLAVLAAVAAHGSFRGAARELAIAPPAVSHAVATLEDSLGVRLLARTTRSVAPTEAGRRLLKRLAPALAEIDQALGAALETKDRPAGILRISAPLVATQLMLAPRLGEFVRHYPDITLDLRIDNAFTDIVAAGFDAGVRLGENLEADMIAVRLGGPQRGAVVGSPAYFEARPAPSHPRDLAQHRCLRQRFPGGRLYRWEFEKNGQIVEIGVEGPLIANDNGILLEAALAGAGLVWLFEDYTRDFLAEGRLVRVLEDWCAPFEGFHLYYPSRRQMRPALRAFIDFYRHGTGTDR